MPDSQESRRRDIWLLAGFVVACLIVVGVAVVRFAALARYVPDDTERDMRTALSLRAAAIDSDVTERIGDATVLATLAVVSQALTPLATPEQRNAAAYTLPDAARQVVLAYGYRSVGFFGTGLEPILPDQPPLAPYMTAAALSAIATLRPVVSDFMEQGDGRLTYAIAAPIFAPSDSVGHLLGVVVLERDATALVARALAPWPSPLQTIALRFVRPLTGDLAQISREDGGHEADGHESPRLRLTLLHPGMDGVLDAAVSQDGTRTFETTDPRGVKVFVAAATMLQTPWRLLVRVDRAELDGQANDLAAAMAALSLFMVAAAAISLAALWRREYRRRQQRLAVLSRQSLDALQTMADGFLRVARDGTIQDVNAAALAITGYTREDLLGRTIDWLLDQQATQPPAQEWLERQSSRSRLASRWLRADGQAIDVEGTATFVSDDVTGHFYLIVRDMSAERRAQRRLERLNNLNALLNHVHRVIAHQHDIRAIVTEIGRSVAVDSDIPLVWTGWVNRAEGAVEILSCSGPAFAYAENLVITLDPGEPTGQGPSAVAIRERRTVISNDLQGDPATHAWHERAIRHGLRASVALPLFMEGEVVALLTIYSKVAWFFDNDVIDLVTDMAETISTALDAAQSRRLAADLRQEQEVREARLRLLLQSVPVPMLVSRAPGDDISNINAAFEARFGPVRSTFGTVQAWLDDACVDPQGRQMLRDQRSRYLAGVRDPEELGAIPEMDMRCQDGTIRRMQGSLTFAQDEVVWAWIDLTDLRAREKALRRREDITATIFEQTGDALMLFDEESGAIVEFNSAAHRLHGYTREEFAQLNLRDLQTVKRPYGPPGYLSAQLEPSQSVVVVRKLQRKDGTQFDARISICPILVDGRRRVATITTDITEELRLAQTLAADAERRRVLFDHATHGIAVFARDGRVIDANDSFLSQFHVMRESLADRTAGHWRIMLPAQAADGAGTNANMIREATLRRDDGSGFDGELIWSVAKLPEGEVLYCTVLDVTARKEGERALARMTAGLETLVAERTAKLDRERAVLLDTNREMSAILETAPVGIGLFHDRIVLRCNAALEAMLGCESGEMLNTSTRSWYATTEEFDRIGRIQNAAIESGDRRFQWETEFVRRDGVRIWVRVNGSRFHTRSVPDAVLSIIEDITAERDSALALRAARDAADAASRAKSTFLATMSHEIRTPLNAVIGMSELLVLEDLPDSHAEALEIIHNSAVGLMALIDDILDFSRIEADRVELERGRLSLTKLVEGVCDTLLPNATAKGVRLKVFIAPDAPEVVQGDVTRLRQVLFNVLGNAVKFSGGREGQIGHVAIRVELADAAPMRLRFDVTDNGIGMAPETLAGLFAPFVQAESSTVRRFGGSGLGLAITQRLVGLMGGTIAVRSTLGEGSTFSLTIPLEPLPDQRRSVVPDLTGVTCVVVEGPWELDAQDIRHMLEAAGASVRLAATAETAMALADGTDAVVVRAEMGKTDAPGGSAPCEARSVLLRWDRHWRARLGENDTAGIDLGWLRRTALVQVVGVAAGLLPRVDLADHHRRDLDVQAVPAPTVEEARAQGRLILLVEDDETNRRVIMRQLHRIGHAAEISVNGRDGLEKWRSGRYGLVLTDLRMPEMDGFQLTHAIRADELARGIRPDDPRHTPILALTASAQHGELEMAIHQGFDQFLTKPIHLRDLQSALTRSLGGATEPAASASAIAAPAPARTTAAQGAFAVYDARVLAELVGDDPDVMADLLSDYLTAAADLAAQIRQSAASGDAAQCATLAHRMKSSSRAVGALRLGEACFEIEKLGKAGHIIAIREFILKFDGILQQARQEIKAHLETMKIVPKED